jgi:hypothetical protein
MCLNHLITYFNILARHLTPYNACIWHLWDVSCMRYCYRVPQRNRDVFRCTKVAKRWLQRLHLPMPEPTHTEDRELIDLGCQTQLQRQHVGDRRRRIAGGRSDVGQFQLTARPVLLCLLASPPAGWHPGGDITATDTAHFRRGGWWGGDSNCAGAVAGEVPLFGHVQFTDIIFVPY